MFSEAIVRAVPGTIDAGITSANLGRPDYENAREQHDRYVGTLERCGLEVTVLDADEEYCANCIRVNDHVLVAVGYEGTKEKIAERGYEVIELEMSEFRKVDGGLSCLSLRLPVPGGLER